MRIKSQSASKVVIQTPPIFASILCVGAIGGLAGAGILGFRGDITLIIFGAVPMFLLAIICIARFEYCYAEFDRNSRNATLRQYSFTGIRKFDLRFDDIDHVTTEHKFYGVGAEGDGYIFFPIIRLKNGQTVPLSQKGESIFLRGYGTLQTIDAFVNPGRTTRSTQDFT